MQTKETLKTLIKDTLHLDDLQLADFEDNALLFGPDGIGLDSLDAVELVIIVQKHFGVQIRNMDESRAIFRSVKTLAEFIDAQRAE